MTKADQQVEAIETEETPEVVTPGELAALLKVDPKRIRSFLRAEFPRPKELKNSSWHLTEEQIAAVIEKFEVSETNDSDDSDEEA